MFFFNRYPSPPPPPPKRPVVRVADIVFTDGRCRRFHYVKSRINEGSVEFQGLGDAALLVNIASVQTIETRDATDDD